MGAFDDEGDELGLRVPADIAYQLADQVEQLDLSRAGAPFESVGRNSECGGLSRQVLEVFLESR